MDIVRNIKSLWNLVHPLDRSRNMHITVNMSYPTHTHTRAHIEEHTDVNLCAGMHVPQQVLNKQLPFRDPLRSENTLPCRS